jgi:CBS domain-containing protein
MPFLIHQFIQDRNPPLYVLHEEKVSKALQIMLDNDFSQIPIVDKEGFPLGMITNESIIRGILNFDVSVNDLYANDVIQPVKRFRTDDDIFDLLNELKSSYAVLIVDAESKLVDIYTSYDALDFFRLRFDDFMMVEDIEGMIKELIIRNYRDKNGNLDIENDEVLKKLIKENDYERNKLRTQLCKSISYYLNEIQYSDSIKMSIIEKCIDQITEEEKGRDFKDLSYDNYVKILINDEIWNSYKDVIKMNKLAVQNLLDEVRKSRNILAHFKGELSQTQRSQLEFCKNWLNTKMEFIEDVEGLKEHEILIEEKMLPVEEEIIGTEGKYSPIYEFLKAIPVENDRITLNFNKLEDIIGSDLPESARKHRAWWANDSVAHSHSRLWLEAGWRTSYLNLTEEKVTFARVKGREKAYIEFFNNQKKNLQDYKEFPLKESNPDGQGWLVVAGLQSNSPQYATYNFSFARGGRYRIEIYIDSGDMEKNKSIFDELFSQKEEIEKELEFELTWERMKNRRASRIANYQSGKIDDYDANLVELSKVSAKIMNELYTRTFRRLSEAIRKFV